MKLSLLPLSLMASLALAAEEEEGPPSRVINPGFGNCWSSTEAIMRSEIEILTLDPASLEIERIYKICEDTTIVVGTGMPPQGGGHPLFTFNPYLNVQCQDLSNADSCVMSGGTFQVANIQTTEELTALVMALYPNGFPYPFPPANYTGPDSSHLTLQRINFDDTVTSDEEQVAAVVFRAPGFGTEVTLDGCKWINNVGPWAGLWVVGSSDEVPTVLLDDCVFQTNEFLRGAVVVTGADGTEIDLDIFDSSFDTNAIEDPDGAIGALVWVANTNLTIDMTNFESSTIANGLSVVTAIQPSTVYRNPLLTSGLDNEIENDNGSGCLEIGIYSGSDPNFVLEECITFEGPAPETDGLTSEAKGGIILGSVLAFAFFCAWLYVRYYKSKRAAGFGEHGEGDDMVKDEEAEDA